MDAPGNARRLTVATPNPRVKWGAVAIEAKRILIVASGPSMRALRDRHFDRLASANVHIIAVNNSIEWIPRADSWFTLDPNEQIRAVMRKAAKVVTAYAAVPHDYGREGATMPAHRPPPEAGVVFLRRLVGVGPFKSRWGLSPDPGKINTGNSAYGALGLAFHMKPERIGIVGLDGTVDGYAYGNGKPHGTFGHLPDLFASALPQLAERGVEVSNGSPQSVVTAFERISPIKAIQKLCK